MVGSQEVRESIVKTQRRDKTPRSENHEVVSTLAIAILHAAGKTKKAAELRASPLGEFVLGLFYFLTGSTIFCAVWHEDVELTVFDKLS